MAAVSDGEFLRLLKKDIDYYERAVKRFEDLIPRVCAPVQDQWRLQAQSRRNFALELEILLEKAQECVNGSVGLDRNNKKSSEIASC
jgi:hypothetical protein